MWAEGVGSWERWERWAGRHGMRVWVWEGEGCDAFGAWEPGRATSGAAVLTDHGQAIHSGSGRSWPACANCFRSLVDTWTVRSTEGVNATAAILYYLQQQQQSPEQKPSQPRRSCCPLTRRLALSCVPSGRCCAVVLCDCWSLLSQPQIHVGQVRRPTRRQSARALLRWELPKLRRLVAVVGHGETCCRRDEAARHQGHRPTRAAKLGCLLCAVSER